MSEETKDTKDTKELITNLSPKDLKKLHHELVRAAADRILKSGQFKSISVGPTRKSDKR